MMLKTKNTMKKTNPKNEKSKEGPNILIMLQPYQRKFFMSLLAETGVLDRWRAGKKSNTRDKLKDIPANKTADSEGR